MSGVRLSSSRLAEVSNRLSLRDIAIVTTVSKFRLVTTKQIERLFFIDGTTASNQRMARLALARLAGLRVLHRLERQVGGVRAGSKGQVYSLDVAGQFVCGLTEPNGRKRKPFEPGWPFVNHVLTITELYVRLVEESRRGPFELVQFDPEPDSWRSFFGPGGSRLRLKPDAFVRTAKGDFEELRFVEVDLATESSKALATKFRTYRQYWGTGREQQKWDGIFPKVLWLVPHANRLKQVVDVAASQPAESWKVFGVRPFDEGMSAFKPGGES